MSAETTPAYVRAVEAAAGSYSTPDGVADAVLDAALDVEEMAAMIWTASRADEGTISATGAKHVAAALRTALLGGVS